MVMISFVRWIRRGTIPLVAMALLLGFVGKGPVETIKVRTVTETVRPETASSNGSLPGRVAKRSGGLPAVPPGRFECAAGKNGGATARGVTATEIRLATTAVLDGPAASLLRDSPIGIKGVIDSVNASGGICGRRLKLHLVNDGFDSALGHTYLQNFMSENYFALPVVPSAEGLGAAIKSGDISRNGIPVVGTDGMRQEQYEDPWVWPVATATVSTMRIMARHGFHQRGARTFAIVYDSKYKFGKEGKDAFIAEVKRLGGTLVAEQPLDPDQNSYSTEVSEFNRKCGGDQCDMVALLLLPDAAKTWLTPKPVLGLRYTSGAQTLFTNKFAQDCVQAAGDACNGIDIWTGYNPPIGSFAGLPGVSRYVNDVKTVSPGVDERNQFVEGAYLGMSLFVAALRIVGPELTRERLRAVLDSMDYRTDITSTLQWRPGAHRANVRARGFSIVVSGGKFLDWRDANTGWVTDPRAAG
jgi:branched-chain amino acid transport system substrate-binding protein